MEGSLCRFSVESGGFVGDGCHHASAAVPAGVVVEAVAPLEDDGLGLSGVDDRCRDSTSHSREEKKASAAALSKQDPTRPMDWRMPILRHSFMNDVAV